MGKFFNLDSPLMRFLNRMTDLLWLNILTLVCSLPIITIGASFTALNFVCLKLVRGEEGYVTRDFFRSFKENFKQATLIWLMELVFIFIVVVDFWYLLFSQLVQAPMIILIVICAAVLIVALTSIYIFPVLSHFSNTIRGTIKNAFLMSILTLPKTVLMLIMGFVPLAALYFLPQIAPLAAVFYFSLPAYMNALLYNKTFKRFEPEVKDNNDDFTWSVGSDEPSMTESNQDNKDKDESANNESETM